METTLTTTLIGKRCFGSGDLSDFDISEPEPSLFDPPHRPPPPTSLPMDLSPLPSESSTFGDPMELDSEPSPEFDHSGPPPRTTSPDVLHPNPPKPSHSPHPSGPLHPHSHLTNQSSMSVSEASELSSMSSALSSKATTPVDSGSSRDVSGPASRKDHNKPKLSRRSFSSSRPKLSIPSGMASREYATECILAADWSMLNAYALHQDEHNILRQHLSHAQVTTYLNIRNGIIRLWAHNPQVVVTREEALGCARDPKWFELASFTYDWLVRQGHINFGCIAPPKARPLIPATNKGKQKTIVVIGAGLSGLGCARQLDGLFLHYVKSFLELDQVPPRVIVLEGRSRVGGRVYSRPLQANEARQVPGFKGERYTAEMGGMIVTGFERGNPLNMIIRGQLKLPYHELKPELVIYDMNGKPVDEKRDGLAEGLYNDCLDRVSPFKYKLPPPKIIEGNRELMDEGRDSNAESQKTMAASEDSTPVPSGTTTALPSLPTYPEPTTSKPSHENPSSIKPAAKMRNLGWQLRSGVSDEHDIDLQTPSQQEGATLGFVVDQAISQCKQILDLTPLDFRLLNWHIANLEYSNATNYNNLSLQGWDIDAGNEWEGTHTMIAGGYQNVPRGLRMSPTPLDVRTKAPVSRISYTSESTNGPAQVECEDGTIFDADFVVNTIPLGVLKQGTIKFEPSLPKWKTNAIDRLGFGVLNKVILVYDEMFWDPDRHFFGSLRNPTHARSVNQKDYTSQRGRFFQWLNVSDTSGVPVLLALMAGDAALDVEHTSNDDLVREATDVLRTMFGPKVPYPKQALVSRWASDRFARGSYSSAGPNMKIDDYDTMARPLGNLFFAGEHTTGTHPATVHGAYLSGLRVASEVLDAILGPLQVPVSLVPPKETALKRKAVHESAKDHKRARLEAWDLRLWDFTRAQLGEYPERPGKMAATAYLLFTKAHHDLARQKCAEGRRAGKAKPAPNEIRVMMGKMWKEAGGEERKPYEEEAERVRVEQGKRMRDWEGRVREWERRALEVRAVFEKGDPEPVEDEGVDTAGGDGGRAERKKRRGKRIVASYAESAGSDPDL